MNNEVQVLDRGLVVKEVEFNEATLLAVHDTVEDKKYVAVKWVSEGIGLSEGQYQSQTRKIQEDLVLKQGVKMLKQKTKGGFQDMLHLELNYLPIWLSKINTKSLNGEQYKNIVELLNFCLSDDFLKYKIPTKTYQWEAELRDELYEIGYFDKYKILDKEVEYSFGRVDLLAQDEDGKIAIIELKKNKNYNNVIEQCIRYIDGFKREFKENVKIVICTLDNNEEFTKQAKNHNFSVYAYKRELKLIEIHN